MSARMSRIESALQRLTVTPQQRRGRSKSRSRSRSRRRNEQMGRAPTGSSSVVIDLKTEEVLCTLTMGAGLTEHSYHVSLRPGGTNNSAGHLGALAKLYERMKWHSVTVHYIGSVGSTVGGTVAVGIDYDTDITKPLTLAQVAAMQPNRQVSAFKNVSFTVPIKRMEPQRWMSTENDTEAPHPQVCIHASGGDLAGKGYGYIRIAYHVSFAGFKLP